MAEATLHVQNNLVTRPHVENLIIYFLYLISLQDEMEKTDGCRIRTAGWSRKLFGLAENVPVPVFLSPELVRNRGQHDSGRRRRCHVQQYVPDSVYTASISPETARP